HGSTAQGIKNRTPIATRPFVLSRAFFAGTQRHGAIWTGDNMATWDQLRYTNPMLLTIGVSGLPFAGADVGGFFNNPAPDLLVRWYQAGAFQPFLRAHAHIDTKRREPWLFGEPYTTIIRDVLRERYKLLPYWYTLFFDAHRKGIPAMRPMFVEFPKDEETFAMDDQFMVGAGLLVKPVTTEGADTAEVYLPGDEISILVLHHLWTLALIQKCFAIRLQPWYDYRSFKPYPPRRHTVAAPLDIVPVFVRGGHIIPRRDRPRRSSAGMKLDPFTLVIALDNKGQSTGTLYLDDGETYAFETGAYIHRSFHYASGVLTTRSLHLDPTSAAARGFAKALEGVRVERLIILGALQQPAKVIVKDEDGTERQVEFEWVQREKRLTVRDPRVSVVGDKWSVRVV
ncbi:LOW QUALITY PROTEIN: glycosyl hydrolases family 31-domain-containing protein, partial [Jimgerdemannia flammicorona]